MKLIDEYPTPGGTCEEALRLLEKKGDDRPGRLVSLFASLDRDRSPRVHYVIDLGERDYRVIDHAVRQPLTSATTVAPAAAWYERELHDQYGIQVVGHPDLRPLLLHENWPTEVHPMVDPVDNVAWASNPYPFLTVQGQGVCEVPVGPVHAGIIEPGHFRFSVVGDTVVHLELRHFYTHKGTEKLFEGSPVTDGSMIAESVSGDNCFAHAVAYAQAVENAYKVFAPPKATAIRLVGLELERMMAHIGDVGALCGDVGFSVPAAHTARLKEFLLRASNECFGTRFLRGLAVPGGVKRDISPPAADKLAQSVRQAHADFVRLAHIILDSPSVQNRFESAGYLTDKVARDLAVVGPVARASGIDIDVRRDHPYGLYHQMKVGVPRLHYGDVLARARIRIDEASVSCELVGQALHELPAGPIRASDAFEGSARGFSAVESPRGELLYWVEAYEGRIARCHIKSPSFQNWPALPFAVADNVIADFPLINKSFNLSYSGCDR
jgi:Ni,Fe-hydrogenase III large subunit